MRRLIESMDKISEAAPATPAAAQKLGPIDTAIQNVQSNWATAKQVPGNIRRLASDPVQYIKDLPPLSPEQWASAWSGGGLRSGGLLKGISAPGAAAAKSPMASMAQQLTQPSSTGGKITTSPTGITHTAGPKLANAPVAQPAAPAVWRNPRTGETSATAPGAKQTTAVPKETTPADLQKLANVPVTRTAEPGGRIEPKFDMDEEKIVPGTKFPGYWQGRDSAAKSRDRMVGDESIIKELHNTTTSAEFKLQEQYDQFKKDFGQISPSIADLPKAEVNKQISSVGPSIANLPKAEVNRQISSKAQNPAYPGIDPIVRQRQGMALATQGEIQSYLDRNPPGIKTGDGSAVISGSGAPIQSGGQVDVARAADAASPDRALSVAKPPAKPLDIRNRNDGTQPPLPAAVSTPVAPAAAPVATSIPPAAPAVSTPVKSAVAPATAAAPYKGSAGAQEIQKVNPAIKDVNKIQAGQRLRLPDSDEDYVVQKGDTLDKIGKMYRNKEIGGRLGPIVYGDDPAPTPAAAPASRSVATAAPAAKPAAPPNKPGVATSGPSPRKNYDQLTPQEKQAVDAIDQIGTQARAQRERDVKAAREKADRELNKPRTEAINKLAEQFAAFMEAQDEYGPEYQAMVRRVGDRARQGAMKTVWDPVKRVYKNVPVKQEKPVKEYENAQDQDSQVTSPPAPAATAASQTFVQDKELQNMNAQKTLEADAGAQDPNKQTTSPPSPAAVAQPAAPSAPDVSVATAKTTMAGLKPALGPGVDTNAAATGVAKANLGQQLNPAEQQAVSALTPLVMKAATIPSAAPQLRSALTNAGTMARAAAAQQGKM